MRWQDVAIEFEAIEDVTQDCRTSSEQCMAEEIAALRAQNDVLKRQLECAVAALKKVHDDEETGHWGPDVTMKDVLYVAMKEIQRIGAE